MTIQRHGGDAGSIEMIRHEMGMLHRYAKPQGLHLVHVGGIAHQTLDHVIRAALGCCAGQSINVAEFRPVISTPHPF